ncbi:MAG: YmdB family metallophosphoesterase [Oscillospiraceae bacterium]|nr:YmdB family metallophosphoesterase [Oscillospiraceae bacterium]
MNILAIGDVIGAAGVDFLKKNLWNLRRENNIDCVAVNGENSAAGNGIDIKSANLMIEAGVDMITTGNHIWYKKEIHGYLDENKHILRPANYPAVCPGTGYSIINILGYNILFINLLGTVYFDLGLESPFVTADKIFAREKDNFDFAVVDIHAEATGEKIALAKYIDSNYKAALIFGTHTHIQTADEQILKNGAGYITDLGMTGAFDSVLGMKNEVIIKKYLTKMPSKFEMCEENIELWGVTAEIDETDFKCINIKRVRFT